MAVKMSFKNEKGAIIYKDIPEELVASYLAMKWEIVKATPTK